jgi:hypothetical protein
LKIFNFYCQNLSKNGAIFDKLEHKAQAHKAQGLATEDTESTPDREASRLESRVNSCSTGGRTTRLQKDATY